MLSWSSTTEGRPADLAAIVRGEGDAGLPHGRELVAFAEAVAGYDDTALAAARERLVEVAGEAFMVDAAAVAANFEMMTRVADGTGARFADDPHGHRAALDAQLGIGTLTSAR